jgi:hypothetical protein
MSNILLHMIPVGYLVISDIIPSHAPLNQNYKHEQMQHKKITFSDMLHGPLVHHVLYDKTCFYSHVVLLSLC